MASVFEAEGSPKGSQDVLFVQGGGADAHDGWDIRLVRSLERALGDSWRVHYPRMPDEDNPSYAAWSSAIVQSMAQLDEPAVLVGHSIGGTVLLHTLVEAPPQSPPAALVLLAPPFVGEGGWPSDEIVPAPDLAARLPADMPVLLFFGGADETVPADHVELYARAIPQASVRVLPDRDHQLGDDLSEVAQALRLKL